MPGISLLIDFKKDVQMETAFFTSLDSVLHTEHYKRRILFRGTNFILAFTGYGNYPVTTFTRRDFHFALEGYIYNKPREVMESELLELADLLFQNRETGKELLRKWLLDADGEFIVCIQNRNSGEIILFNDLLGHLPLYFSKNEDYFLISREIGVFQEFLSPVALDRMAMAQYLVFAFPLGERTLFENVTRLKQGAILYCSPHFPYTVIESLHELNFEEKRYASLSLEDNIEASISLLEKACRDRAGASGASRNILWLSGGLDSRTVGAGLKRAGVPFEGITFLDYYGTSILDVEIAEQVANAFRIDWRKVDLPMPSGMDTYTLLRIKCGLNYFGMKFIIPYYREIQSLYGPDFSQFNGNTGMILRDYRAAKRLKSPDDMVKYILSKGGRYLMMGLFSISEAARLTGIPERELIGELRRVLSSYPEESFEQKYVHFVFSGYCYNWHYEGIDMQRFFFWPHIPLESTPFFLYIMNCPDVQKQYYTFFRQLITRLSPETLDIHNASWNSSIHSKKKLLYFFLRSCYNRMPSAVKVAMRKLFRRQVAYSHDSRIMQCFREQVLESPSIGEYLARPFLDETARTCSRREFDTLFTITSLIEYAAAGKSTLQKYGELPLE
ncbi:MAG: hypothetical protein Q8O92_08040 [Candidatus Latescibacter sp.]|nr:hypothetical protein [Candidatus Latescibacter sp.]